MRVIGYYIICYAFCYYSMFIWCIICNASVTCCYYYVFSTERASGSAKETMRGTVPWVHCSLVAGDRTMHAEVSMGVLVRRSPLSCEPSPCNPAAETAPHPLMLCSKSFSSRASPSPEELFVDTDTSATPLNIIGERIHRMIEAGENGLAVRPVRLLRVWISEGLTQADS